MSINKFFSISILLFLLVPSVASAATTYSFVTAPYASIETENRSSDPNFDDTFARLDPTDRFSGSFTTATALGANLSDVNLLRDANVTDFNFDNGLSWFSFDTLVFCDTCTVSTDAQGNIIDWTFSILSATGLRWGDSATAEFDMSGGVTNFASEGGIGMFDYWDVETTATWEGGSWTRTSAQTVFSQNIVEEPTPSVPLPAAAWMLLVAVALLGGLKKQKQIPHAI